KTDISAFFIFLSTTLNFLEPHNTIKNALNLQL
ncbi:MAG: hypothetical protein ACI8YC_001229, partial [Salibacteraceae bacterium]